MLDFIEIAKQCAPTVASETMVAVVKTESDFKPFAIGINGSSRLQRQPATKLEAITTAKWLVENGYNVDLGLGQINSNNLARTSLTIEDAFDSCKNLAAAAKILTDNYLAAVPRLGNGQKALHAAFSTYNTGSPLRGFANGYVQRVLANGGAVAPRTVPTSPASSIGLIPLTTSGPVISSTSRATSGPIRLIASSSESTLAKPLNGFIRQDELELKNLSVSVYEHTGNTTSVYP